MKTQEEILEEIKGSAPGDLKDKVSDIIKKKRHSPEQSEAVMSAWEGLLFWRRTKLELMVKAYETD